MFNLLLLSCLNLKSQVNCFNTLREAKELYEAGQIDEIPEMLSGCMITGFSRTERAEAYKLIIMAYLFDDNQFEAEKAMNDFLKKYPEYEVMPNDPVEFVYLLESYKTSSVYSINLFFGPTISNQRIKEPYSVFDQNMTSRKEKSGTSYQFGFGVSRNIWKDLTVNLDCIYSLHSYSQTEQNEIVLDTLTNKMVKLETEEKLKKIDFPLSLTYSFGKGNLSYFGRVGGIIGLVTKSTLSITKSYSLPYPTSLPQGNSNIIDLRQKYYYAALAGAGIQYKVPRGYFVLDLRYQFGLRNMSTGKDKYTNSKLWGNDYYIDDNYLLNYLSINVGYHFTIYQSKRSRN
jgi:hypothetical protein